MAQLYDVIGRRYADYRRPEPTFAAAILQALDGAETVVNVGAGAGSYEPTDRFVVAVEPSSAMIRQRPVGSAHVVQASAMALPFHDRAFDAAIAVLTVHHWPNRAEGLRELTRVAKDRVVILTHDFTATDFWLVNEYFPQISEIDSQIMPTLQEIRESLGTIEVHPLLVPHDCLDGFLGAYWRRPHAYLDAGVRNAISAFSRLDDVQSGIARLHRDLEDGSWEERNGHLLEKPDLDLGYRLIVARGRWRATN